MTEYRRARSPGATRFFTVNLAERHGNRLLVEQIDRLRAAFSIVQRKHPVKVEAIVVLPDHLHCLWRLPPGDSDYGVRWGLIKSAFSRGLPAVERRSTSRQTRGERGIWQRRFWEHLVRDDEDFARHVDYIHYNPVKHGWANVPSEWKHSSFKRFVEAGIYPRDWGCSGQLGSVSIGE
jgi:REP-associated tyrosine transposase